MRFIRIYNSQYCNIGVPRPTTPTPHFYQILEKPESSLIMAQNRYIVFKLTKDNYYQHISVLQ